MFCDVVTAVATIAKHKGLGIICSVPSLKSIEEVGLTLYTQEIRVIEEEVSYLQNMTYKHPKDHVSAYLVSDTEIDAISICIPITLPIPPSKYSNLLLEYLEPTLRNKTIFCIVIGPNGDWQAYEKD